MGEHIYYALKNISWECCTCGLPSFSSSLFNNTVFETSNTFSYLSQSTGASEADISFNHPNATSSPTKVEHKRNDLPLRILVINCQSIKTPGKNAELANVIESTQADIVIGTESWLKPAIKSPEVFPSNFKCYRKDRESREGGGVFLLISDKYESEEPEQLKVDQECELVWAKIKVQGSKDLYIGSLYRPPDETNPQYLEILESYLAKIPTNKGAHLWLGGDFNLPGIDWIDESIKPDATHKTTCGQLLEISKNASLDQLVTEPTRITETHSSILDLFFLPTMKL
ncbi:hypothetical protein ACJMK2_020153 [Sinanodonta woodiana]|uniref:Endonuclease/exonuclease/phosphatase domain-containing protein n=1 Tax=Sinanodonta woodiana TaxID=1069815 RepID=A0ABD3TY52_SINWO